MKMPEMHSSDFRVLGIERTKSALFRWKRSIGYDAEMEIRIPQFIVIGAVNVVGRRDIIKANLCRARRFLFSVGLLSSFWLRFVEEEW